MLPLLSPPWLRGFLALAAALLASSLSAQNYQPGQTYFGRSNYIEYLAGDMPVILAAPHGGTLKPAELPDRTYGVINIDANTQSLTRDISDAFIARFGGRPHVIICRLHREKIDCNRAIVEGAQGNPLTEQAWTEFQDFIEAAKTTVSNQWGRGLFLDIHGHGHVLQRLELGYLLSASTLNLSDTTLNSNGAAGNSSIEHLDVLSPATFAQLLRGTNSLGGLLAALGFPSVPSPTFPTPGTNDYFNGGYNTAQHGSRTAGTVSAIQIECNFTNVRDSAINRALFADKLAEATGTYFSNHFGFNLFDRLPTISAISNHVINEDGSTSTINVTLADDLTPAGSLVLAGRSSQPALLPTNGIQLGGSGSARTVRVFPATNQFGIGLITLTATDANGGTTNRSFQVTVNPVNDAPQLAALANRTNRVGITLQLTNVATDVDGDLLTYQLLAGPSNAVLNSLTGILMWRPALAQGDSNHVLQFRVLDNGTNTLSATQSVTITVPPLAIPQVSSVGLTNGQLQLQLTGDTGPDYTVLASSNLVNWAPLFTTNSPALPLWWQDTNATAFQRRFYRAVPGP
jgi:hypothetical protein